jgi:hypothetical protein
VDVGGVNDEQIGLEIPRLISPYLVQGIGVQRGESLGRGTFGIVTRERDPRAKHKTIAVKALSDQFDVVKLMREVDHLVKLQRPCIIGIVGWSLKPCEILDGIGREWGS